VIFIASLFVVSEALDATGVTAWAGRQLIARAGELWIGGQPVRHESIPVPYGDRRGCVVVAPDGAVSLLPRDAAPVEPPGDLLQAGPLLLAEGRVVFDADEDREGFSAGSGQFDSDITEGRYPRAALGIGDEFLVAVACDGRRSNVDGGLSMLELAEVLLSSAAERRSTSTEAARRRSSTAATFSTGPTRRRTSRRPPRGGSSARWSSRVR
jgi:hypothetical protein